MINGSGISTLTPEQQSAVFRGSFNRLLIYKDNTSGKINQKILTYIPDIDYLKAHNNDISGNTINKLDADFSGSIEYSKMDGTPLSLFVIKQDKLLNV